MSQYPACELTERQSGFPDRAFCFQNRAGFPEFVIGGGHVGLNICKSLEHLGVHARLLEQNRERANELAEELSKTTVLCGDALDRNLLIQENLGEMDVVVNVTSDDKANILSAILAKQLGAPNVMALINRNAFIPLAESVGLDKVVTPQQITVSSILQHIRRGQIHAVHTLHGGRAEVLEISVSPESEIIGQSLGELTLPAGARLGCIIKPDGAVVMNEPKATLQANDHAVVFSVLESIHALEERF